MNAAQRSIDLSLISHTNAGKTTLTRTLLRRDVGEIRDAPHVTDVSTAHVMIETDDGAVLRLWDTPGFGDTARLLRRLKHADNPLGWVLTQVWDRYTNRPFWCSQQAIRNVREDADVVLYLVNAAEPPADAAYVAMELEILAWTGKPVVLLLNQMGPPRPSGVEAAELAAWRSHVSAFEFVREVMPLDAFARCWVQEGVLLQAVEALVPVEKQAAFRKLNAAWQEANLRVFRDSMAVLSEQLVAAACDEDIVPEKPLRDRLVERVLVATPQPARVTPRERAMSALAERLDTRIRTSTDRLIALHDLEGHAAREVLQRMKDDYAGTTPVAEGYAALLGGFVSGALSGLAADIASGGLTFGAAALGGGVLGALGAGGLARGYNLVSGREHATLRWSDEFLVGLVRSSLLRYLAVAHYGRGRGDFTRSEHPTFWRDIVASKVERRRAALVEILAGARRGSTAGREAENRAAAALTACAEDVLRELYPAAQIP
jgi:hypothetical protein